jgi:hypothetical protein
MLAVFMLHPANMKLPAENAALRLLVLQAGRRPRELLGLMAAGVEALVTMWGAFERSWHSEWLALRASTELTDLNPKLCAALPAALTSLDQSPSGCAISCS